MLTFYFLSQINFKLATQYIYVQLKAATPPTINKKINSTRRRRSCRSFSVIWLADCRTNNAVPRLTRRLLSLLYSQYIVSTTDCTHHQRKSPSTTTSILCRTTHYTLILLLVDCFVRSFALLFVQ